MFQPRWIVGKTVAKVVMFQVNEPSFPKDTAIANIVFTDGSSIHFGGESVETYNYAVVRYWAKPKGPAK